MTPTIIASGLLAAIITLSVIDGIEERKHELHEESAERREWQEIAIGASRESDAFDRQRSELFWWYAQNSEGTP